MIIDKTHIYILHEVYSSRASIFVDEARILNITAPIYAATWCFCLELSYIYREGYYTSDGEGLNERPTDTVSTSRLYNWSSFADVILALWHATKAQGRVTARIISISRVIPWIRSDNLHLVDQVSFKPMVRTDARYIYEKYNSFYTDLFFTKIIVRKREASNARSGCLGFVIPDSKKR